METVVKYAKRPARASKKRNTIRQCLNLNLSLNHNRFPTYDARVNVIALQFDIAWENKAANFDEVRRRLTDARPEKDSLVVLPEMFATGFTMNTGAMAETCGGETEQFLARTAKESGIFLLAGAAMRGLRWGDCTVSPFVCYDLRFPEIFRQAAAAHRPELFVVIANWPEKRIQHWIRLLQARAIENQACVVGVNRIGNDPYYAYGGHSLIIDPLGEILADAGTREGSIQAKLDLANLRKYREGLPFLADMRSR